MHLLQPSINVQLSRKTPGRLPQARAARDPQGLRLPVALQRRRRGRGAAPPGQDARGRARRRLQRLRRGRAPSARRPTSSPATSTCAKVLELALHDGVDPRTGEQLGPAHRRRRRRSRPSTTSSPPSRRSSRHFVDIKIRGNQLIERMYATADAGAVPVACSPTTASRRGRDYNAGGARYNNTFIQVVGHRHAHRQPRGDQAARLRGAARSPLAELVAALDADFAGQRAAAPAAASTGRRKYGNDDDCADDLMVRVFDACFEAVDGRPERQGRRATASRCCPPPATSTSAR